ncbi:MAG: protein kinase [Kiritimatiellae bacterium]|nr:protein kinase [Kiritimatiellia bacterium]
MNVCGDWRLDREIGRGAYGVVYIATNGKGERAAVKVCRREEGGEERYARELRGAKLYSAIPPQEGLVRMRELAEEPWGFYAVMDLADNEFVKDEPYRPKTLASVISGEKALPLGECIKLGTALAKGLAALQRHHLLHRDIKPGNVIYVGGRPVLTDPGLVVEEDKAASLVGTPGYVPPEKNFTNAASDIYSLGLTLKAASFGRHVEDLDKGPVPEADTRARSFPEWHRILNKATDEDHDRRYQSAKALLSDLKSLQLKITIAAKAGSWTKKALLAATAIAVVLIGMSIYNAWLIAFWRDAETSFGAGGASFDLEQSLRFTKVTTSNSDTVAKATAALEELSQIEKESMSLSRRFQELEKVAEEKHARGQSILKEIIKVRNIVKEEKKLQQRVLEVGRSVYGDKWKPFWPFGF